MLPGLISYLLPENWVTTARWETLAAWIYPGSVERFQAPLFMTLALQLSALALLLRHRVRLGAAAMAVSLPLFAEKLFTQLPANQGAIQWYNDTHVLAEHGDSTDPGHWAYHYSIYLLDKSLTLSYQPRRQYLISQLPRLPSISLVIGLILAYLLYLVL